MQQNNNYDDLTSGNSTSDSFNCSCSSFSPFSPFSSFSIPRAVMAASFAAPLVSKLHWRNIIFHVYGLNPKQETAILTLAMSIWGDPRNLIFRYSDGRDKLSANAEILCHLPMAIRSSYSTISREARDAEIDVYAKKKELKKKQSKKLESAKKQLEPQQFQQLKKQLQKQLRKQLQQLELKRSKQWSFIKDRADLVYFLASEYNPWRTSIISTGAKPITYNVYAGCLTGVYTRTIEITMPAQSAHVATSTTDDIDDYAATPATPATSATSVIAATDDIDDNIDDHAPLLDDIGTVVNSLPVLQSNYGFAGKKFIKFVVNLIKTEGEDGEKGEERLKADHERMKAELKPYDSHKGKLNEVAVIALADYYASLSVFNDFNIADKAVDEAVNKAINVNDAVAWREAVQLGRWILLNAIDNPVVLK